MNTHLFRILVFIIWSNNFLAGLRESHMLELNCQNKRHNNLLSGPAQCQWFFFLKYWAEHPCSRRIFTILYLHEVFFNIRIIYFNFLRFLSSNAFFKEKMCILPSYGTAGSMIPRYLFCLFLCTAAPPTGFSIYIFINTTVTFIESSGQSVQMSWIL